MKQIPDDKVDEIRWLTDGELDSFREDSRELEKEIQSFFRAYYISGLILVAAWLMVHFFHFRPAVELGEAHWMKGKRRTNPAARCE